MADLRVNFCGVELKNPVTTASGTFGFGHEYGEFYDLGELGGIGACLGCTCETKGGEGKSVCKNGPVFDATEVFF